MAALLGFALGSGIGYEKQKIQRQRSMDDLLINAAISNPQLGQDPDVQKALKKRGSPELANFIMHAGTVQAQSQKQMQAAFASPATSSGAPGASPATNTPSSPGGLPDYTGQIGQLQGTIQKAEAFMTGSGANYLSPAQREAATSHISDLRSQLSRLQSEQNSNQRTTVEMGQREKDYQQTQDRLDQAHKDSEADKAATRALEAQNHADEVTNRNLTLDLKAHEDSFNDWIKKQTLDEKKDRDADTLQAKREAGFNAQVNSLTNKKLSLMNSLQQRLAAKTYDAKTAQPIIDAYNRNVDKMAAGAKKLGLEFEPDDYKLSIEPGAPGYFGTSVGAGAPSIAEGGGAANLGSPVKDKSGKLIGYTTDGKTMIPVP